MVALQPHARAFAQTETLDRILAIVNGQVIMHSDVRAFIELNLVDAAPGPDHEADVLTYLIERRVILDQVDRFAVAEPSDSAVDRRLEGVRGRLSGGAGLTSVLDRVGLTQADLRQLMSDEIRREAYVAERFAVVDDDLREQARSDWVADLLRRAQVRRVGDREGGPARD